jgi:hypothetical protein
MHLPAIRGVIDRRILVNYRVDPEVVAQILPAPFRPQLVAGHAIAGICLIRLKQLRPAMFPSFVGLGSENAAHRFAVEWDSEDGVRTGVFVPRRDTSSRLTTLAGGRIFPGVQHRAAFDVQEAADEIRIAMRSRDGSAQVLVEGCETSELPAGSVFGSTETASRFFEDGSLGYSPGQSNHCFEGLELRAVNWQVQPFSVSNVESSFFSDRVVFPEGSVTFDHALLMRGIDHSWHSCERIASLPRVELPQGC